MHVGSVRDSHQELSVGSPQKTIYDRLWAVGVIAIQERQRRLLAAYVYNCSLILPPIAEALASRPLSPTQNYHQRKSPARLEADRAFSEPKRALAYLG